MHIMTKDLSELVWTCSRDHLPPQLAGRGVDLGTWRKSFDGVTGIYEMTLNFSQGLRPWIFVPCFVPCTMGKMFKISSDVHSAWMDLVKSQAEIYRPYGVHVTLAKEYRTTSHGVGSSRRMGMQLETVGLHFDIANASPANVESAYYAPQGYAAPLNVTNGQDDLATRLEKLNKLYTSGAITYDEYTRTKSRIINGE